MIRAEDMKKIAEAAREEKLRREEEIADEAKPFIAEALKESLPRVAQEGHTVFTIGFKSNSYTPGEGYPCILTIAGESLTTERGRYRLLLAEHCSLAVLQKKTAEILREYGYTAKVGAECGFDYVVASAENTCTAKS